MLVYPVTDDSALIKALLFFNSVSVFGFVCFSISFLSWKYFLYPNYCFVKLKVVFFLTSTRTWTSSKVAVLFLLFYFLFVF